MLIRYFKSSFLTQYIMLFVMMLALWLPSFLHPPEVIFYEGTSPLWNMLADMLHKLPLLGVILSFVIAYLSALLLNSVLSEHRLIPRNSLLAGFVYVLLISSSYHFHQLNPIMVVNLLIILELFYLFQLYALREAYKVAFSVGFFTSIAFLLYPPVLYLLIPMYLIFMTMGNLSWREWLIPLIAFCLPIVYVWVYYFWIGESISLLNIFVRDFTNFSLFQFRFDLINWIKIAILLPLFFITFFQVLNEVGGQNIDQRKKTFALLHFFIFCSLIFLFVVFPYRQFSLLFAPVAAFISMWLSEPRKEWRYNLAFFLVILASVIDNYKLMQFF